MFTLRHDPQETKTYKFVSEDKSFKKQAKNQQISIVLSTNFL